MSDDDSIDTIDPSCLDIQKALDIARNTEGDLDPNVSNYLESAVNDIWGRINSHPDSYVLTRDEFAVFNYYIRRFDGLPIAQNAVARYWLSTAANQPAPRS